MLLHYFKIALRNVMKYKIYSTIGIGGLAIGMAVFMLIIFYIKYELSYDKFYDNAENIYRVAVERSSSQAVRSRAVTPFPLARVLRTEFPEVSHSTSFVNYGSLWFRHADRSLQIGRVMLADSNFFDIFSLPLKAGDPQSALSEPRTVVLSASTADRFFGEIDPIGKSLMSLDSGNEYKVTGIAEVPANSHFHFDMLMSYHSSSESWLAFGAHTYIALQKGHAPSHFEAKLPALVKKYASSQVEETFKMPFEEYQAAGSGFRYFLQPLSSIHLHSNLEREIEPNSNIIYVRLLAIIATAILLLACINFVNLTTARSVTRAKEVGLKKVLGGERKQLILQFLLESIFLSAIAFFIAILLIQHALPLFNSLTHRTFTFVQLMQIENMLIFLSMIPLISLLSGIYPAFFLSAVLPIQGLVGQFSTKIRLTGSGIRKLLVTFQFGISFVLLVATIVILRQLDFLQNKDLGLNTEQVIVINRAEVLGKQETNFKNALRAYPQIVSVSSSSSLPGMGHAIRSFFQESMPDKEHLMHQMSGDYETISTLGVTLASGRNFAPEFATDRSAALINESAAKQLGWQNPIGKRLKYGDKFYEIIGIVENFNFQSLHHQIQPFFLRLGGSGLISIRIDSENITEVLAKIEKTWRIFASSQPLDYSFLDEEFAAQYQSEKRLGKLFVTFSTLGIIIACLGLFGLTTFATERRRKEIGIRKVLGASVASVTALLSKDFVKLVLLANLIAWPLAWIAMNKWLQNFAYRIDIGWWVFVLAGGLALVIALLTVSTQA
ncbi:MAG: ABC transporter permease, partial [bacterium]